MGRKRGGGRPRGRPGRGPRAGRRRLRGGERPPWETGARGSAAALLGEERGWRGVADETAEADGTKEMGAEDGGVWWGFFGAFVLENRWGTGARVLLCLVP